MDCEPILDPMLIQCVSILEDLACEDQDQLILLSLKPPGDFLLELRSRGRGHWGGRHTTVSTPRPGLYSQLCPSSCNKQHSFFLIFEISFSVALEPVLELPL